MHLARSQAFKRGVASTSIHKLPHVGQCDAEHGERVIGHGSRGHERDDVDVGRSERGHSILRHGLELCALQTRGCATGWRPGSSGSSVRRVRCWLQWFGRWWFFSGQTLELRRLLHGAALGP